MEIPILSDIVIILSLSVLVIFIFQKLRLPTILGFLITGIIVGPNGLRLIYAVHEIEILAEIGVILLLFIIGMEFSLRTMASIQRIVLLGGFIQVGGTIGLTFLAAYGLGYPWNQALFLGFLVSLSSTAIVLTLLQERGAVNAAHGKIALAILIFQDIIVVPMMLFAPLMTGEAENIGGTLLVLLLKAALVVALVLLSARYLAPRLLELIARTQSQELFLLSVIAICFAVAWGTSSIGLSLALGAFMAGLVISESEYSYQATALVLPFREIFTSFFFVSIGMLLDMRFFIANIGVVLLLTLGVMLGKLLIAGLAALALRYPLRTALLTGFALLQIGEFAFILSETGIEYNLISEEAYQYFLAVSILSMAVTPFAIKYAPGLTDWILRSPMPDRLRHFNQLSAQAAGEPDEAELEDHVIIIGYGLTGRNVAQAAQRAHIPYVVVDLDPGRVEAARRAGHPATYGDAMSSFVLHHVHVYSARVAVISVTDPDEAKRIVTQIRTICQTVYLIVRTRMVSEVDEFYGVGVNEVIPEEFEVSIEIFTRLLNRYLVPQDEVEDFAREIRAGAYDMLRPQPRQPGTQDRLLNIPDVNLTCLRALHSENEVIGKTLAEAGIREKYNVNLIAIMRDAEFITEIRPDTEIRQHDVLYLIGEPEAIDRFNAKLKY